jgi:hypothetical protein
VIFRRWRHLVEISWGLRRLAGQPDYFRFLANDGFARLPVAEVAQPLYSVLRQAAAYLAEQASGSARLAILRAGLDSLRTDHSDKRLALLAGLGATLDEQEERWQEVNSRLQTHPEAAAAALSLDHTELFLAGSCQAALMFGSVAPTVDANDVIALASSAVYP